MNERICTYILRLRNRHILLLDVLFLLLTPVSAVFLRVDSYEAVAALGAPLLWYTGTSLAVKIGVYHYFCFYARYWMYASIDEIIVLAAGTIFSWIACAVVFFFVLRPLAIVPRAFPSSVPFIDGILTMVLVGGVRMAIRLTYVLNERRVESKECKRILIVGAGLTGSMIVKELRAKPQLAMRPEAFVDDDPAKQQLIIHGVMVMGTIECIPEIVRRKQIDEVVIAMPAVSGKTIRRIVDTCAALNLRSKTIPGLFDILSGSAVAQLRDVDIDDLLRREIVHVDEENVARFIRGARVMVTGAGGSIGSELCRQIVKYRPDTLVMLGHGENSIFQIANELRAKHNRLNDAVSFRSVIADIRDRRRMTHVMDEHRPQIVFHAAAHKHVGLMEGNISDAVSNNVFGTKLMVELASQAGVEKFVLISSDKAVNPMCVMGVTKRVAELVVHDAAACRRQPFVTVRFGNVLGSRGSIVPILKNQIAEGGPVTVTHPDATRFFMSIPEAVQLVLQAGAMGTCGETFVLDMGKPVKIIDLARDLIRLSGLCEGTDIDIEFTGLKGGEKMHEELFYGTEEPERSCHEKIFVCRNNGHVPENGELHSLIDALHAASRSGDCGQTHELLRKIVVQYRLPANGDGD